MIKKKTKALVDETPVEIAINLKEASPPKTHTITLAGSGQTLQYGINGQMASLPCGVEITVSESVYHAVKAHIISERE